MKAIDEDARDPDSSSASASSRPREVPGSRPPEGSGSTTQSPQDDHDVELEGVLNSLVQTIHHFFGGIVALFRGVEDPRVASRITYPLTSQLMAGMLMFLFHLGARRQIALQLRNARGKRSHKVHVLQCVDSTMTSTGKVKTGTHRWVGNVKIGPDSAVDVAAKGGRIRWKIENEGFNVQKNRGYGLEHAYSKDPVSAKVFYYLLQIGHMIFQLLEKGSLLKKSFPKGLGSAKNLALRLLEAWRNLSVWTAEALSRLLEARIQIRLNSS